VSAAVPVRPYPRNQLCKQRAVSGSQSKLFD
jgi:hypothetical protein